MKNTTSPFFSVIDYCFSGKLKFDTQNIVYATDWNIELHFCGKNYDQICFVNKRPTGLDGHLNAIAFKSTCLHLKLYFTCSLDLNSRFLRLFSPTFILCCLQTANPFKDNVERGKSQRSLGLFIVYLEIEAKNCKRLVNRDLQTFNGQSQSFMIFTVIYKIIYL